MHLAIPVASVILMALAARLRHGDMAATAGVLFANWLVNSGLCWAVHDASPWLLFMITDYLSGLAVFLFLSSRWQSGVIAVFAIMEVIHAGYGLSAQDEMARYVYWWALYWAALAQVGVVGGWMTCELVRSRLRSPSGSQPDMAANIEVSS